MAERAVFVVLQMLADPLIKEALFLYGVSDEVEWLKDELQWMQRFLIDAEAKRRGGNEVIKHWLKKVREVAHQAEDIIDNFTLDIESKKKKKKRGLLQRFKSYAAFPCALKSRHNLGTEIEGLKANIEHIKKGKTDYNLIETTPTVATDEAIQARRRIYAHLNDTTIVVGLDVHTEEIVNRLLDTNIKHRSVVSIVGIGGLGKTTLANKVYNNTEIKANFKVSACFSVSQHYKVHEIIKVLVKQMMGKSMADLQSMDVDELSEMLREFLAQRKYLIVLDDVWSRDVWDHLIRAALPEKKNGSRVLLTTRNTDLAKSIDRTIPPYELPFLNEDESWALFLNKAFLPDETCPGELEEIGRRLVKRCGGLPLALEVLGGILSLKEPNSVAWTSVAEHFVWSSTVDGGNCSKILGLSYDDLPHHHLKSCFLYLGVFPEDSVIYAQELIELWIAEGFIPQQLETQRLMEDAAHAYLEELAGRSMIQVVDKDWLGSSASVKSFRIHDLFRDLCIREAREDDLFNIYNTTTSNSINIHGKNLRRLIVHGDISTTTIADLMLPPNLKSILHFGCQETGVNLSTIVPDGLKLLRVIHLVEVNIWSLKNAEKFPEIFDKMITNMRHLRYIRLSGYSSEFQFLPPCIQNLSNLQTLYLSPVRNVTVLPDWLGEIRTLRHLYLYSHNHVSCLGDVGSLTNLQTLYVQINVRELMKHGMEKLVNIRNLKVSNLDLDGEEQWRVFIDSLRKMKYLSGLEVDNGIIPTELLSVLAENTHLRYLDLNGHIMSVLQPVPESLQHGFRFPPNLTTLILAESELVQDPMATLEKLPYLRELTLQFKSYIGKEMVCTSGGFPRLQELNLFHLNELEEWRVEDGAMPSLIALEIFFCSNLKTLPEGMQHLRSLRALFLRGYPQDRVRAEVGEDWYKIKHVPQIIT